MLVLTRRKNESILVGSEIEIKVLKCQKRIVVIGIRAPADIRIQRSSASGTDSKIPESSTAGGKSIIESTADVDPVQDTIPRDVKI